MLNATDTVLITNLGPSLNFTSPTLGNGSNITINSAQANISITEPSLDTFKFNWNGTNYSIYDPTLVLALNLNNNSAIGESSSLAVDISIYGNNGNLTSGANWTASGRYGSAVNLDGSNDYVNISGGAQLNGATQATFMAWVKYAGALNNDDDIFTKGNHGLTASILIWRDYSVGSGDQVGDTERTFGFDIRRNRL